MCSKFNQNSQLHNFNKRYAILSVYVPVCVCYILGVKVCVCEYVCVFCCGRDQNLF